MLTDTTTLIIRRNYFLMESEAVIVRTSPIHGKGLFAARDLGLGDILLSMDPGLFSEKDRHPWNTHNTDILPHYVNHSCDPNAAIVFNHTKHAIEVVAVKAIPTGAEVVLDYALTEVGGEMLTCTCGSPQCRGQFPVNRFVSW